MHIKYILYHKCHHRYIVQKFNGMVIFKEIFFLKITKHASIVCDVCGRSVITDHRPEPTGACQKTIHGYSSLYSTRRCDSDALFG